MKTCTVCNLEKPKRRFTYGESVCTSCNMRKPKISIALFNVTCLRCDKEFEAESKFIRRCETCKKSDTSRSMDMWE